VAVDARGDEGGPLSYRQYSRLMSGSFLEPSFDWHVAMPKHLACISPLCGAMSQMKRRT